VGRRSRRMPLDSTSPSIRPHPTLGSRLDEVDSKTEELDAAVQEVRDDLDSLCSSLNLTEALSSEILWRDPGGSVRRHRLIRLDRLRRLNVAALSLSRGEWDPFENVEIPR